MDSHLYKYIWDIPHMTNSDFEELTRRMDGFCGSDIAVCVSDIANSDNWVFKW